MTKNDTFKQHFILVSFNEKQTQKQNQSVIITSECSVRSFTKHESQKRFQPVSIQSQWHGTFW